MKEKNTVYELIMDKMRNYPGRMLGVADISYSEYSSQYKRAGFSSSS